jgi:hypothetical protein
MNFFKRARVAGLGLFLLFFASLSYGEDIGLSFSGDIGSLLALEDGATWYWLNGVSFYQGDRFFLRTGYGQIISNLPQASFTGSLFFSGAGLNFKYLGLYFNGGFIDQLPLKADLEEMKINNGGGAAYFVNPSLSFNIGPFDFSPSYVYAHGEWQNGDFDWFFGKPSLPAIHVAGLSATYRKQHTLDFNYLLLDADILNNENSRLFSSHWEAATASYNFSFRRNRTFFRAGLGILNITGTAEGALTAENQQYLFFPFGFFNVSGNLNSVAAYGFIHLVQGLSIFQLDAKLGFVNIFQGEFSGSSHYKMKRLFGGSEATDTYGPYPMAETGLGVLVLDASIPGLKIRGSGEIRLDLGLRKILAVPWGYEKYLGEQGGGESGASPDGPDPELIRTILLSGLSFYVKFYH